MPNITFIVCYGRVTSIQYDFYFLRIKNLPEKIITKITNEEYNSKRLMLSCFEYISIVNQDKNEEILNEITSEKFDICGATNYVFEIVTERPRIFKDLFAHRVTKYSQFEEFLTQAEIDSNDYFYDIFDRMSTERKEEIVDYLFSEFITIELREVDYRNPTWLFYGV